MVDGAAIGFKENDLQEILGVLKLFPEVQEVILFGSRAKGNHRPGSDVDLALKIAGSDVTNRVSGVLNDELMLPYKFDVLNIDSISSPDLLDHIERIGISLFETSH
jgi:predicted nucleotidyltransferase